MDEKAGTGLGCNGPTGAQWGEVSKSQLKDLEDMKYKHCGQDISASEILKSFDAVVWAKAFVKHVKANPDIATDEATMTAWFANALMRGYDEHYWRSKKYKRVCRRLLVPWWKRLFIPLNRYGH